LFLISGWSKYTLDIEKPLRNAHGTNLLAMINLESFQRSLIAIEDNGSAYPHSWLFVPERKYWANAFVVHMRHDIDVNF